MRNFASQMPERPPRQKHAPPKASDNFAFLRSLDGDEVADVNVTWFWNNPTLRTEASGGLAYGLHYASPGLNGYTHIRDLKTGEIRPMKPWELRTGDWTAPRVADWRRGPREDSPAPQTLWHLYQYVAAEDGVILAEIKSPNFGRYPFIMAQLVRSARRWDQPPWYKALASMKMAEEKCANTQHAGGQFALAFGSAVTGREARLRAGRRITADWAVKPTRIW